MSGSGTTKSTKTCVDCGKAISPTATRCRPCNRDSPIIQQRIKEVQNRPEVKKKRNEAIKEAHRRKKLERAKVVERGFNKNSPVTRERGREITKNRGIHNVSKLETRVITIINELGFECRQSHQPKEINYIYDGFIREFNTLIEVDGSYWHSDEMMKKKGAPDADRKKTALAHAAGYGLIRFKEEDLPQNPSDLREHINKVLAEHNIQ